jgi:mannosyltransferase OCH1-like enzyme
MIPLIIHQIWFQGIKNIIQPYKNCFIKTIKFLENTNWDHYFWDKTRIEKFIIDEYPDYWDCYNKCNILVQKLDIARYLILYHYGGCYMDMDMEILKNFADLLEEEDELVFSLTKQFGYNNSILFSSKNNKFWLDFLKHVDKKINLLKFDNMLNIQFSTGPINFTSFININKRNYKIKSLPFKYLEPCESSYNTFITDEAYVINHYGNSWINSFYKYFIKLYNNRNNLYIIIIIVVLLIIFRNKINHYLKL